MRMLVLTVLNAAVCKVRRPFNTSALAPISVVSVCSGASARRACACRKLVTAIVRLSADGLNDEPRMM